MLPEDYNDREARELGWLFALPMLAHSGALDAQDAPLAAALRHAEAVDLVTRQRFTSEVRGLQRRLALKDDGFFGPATWAAFCRRYRGRVTGNYLRVGGCRVPVAMRESIVLEHPPVDLFGHFGHERKSLKGVVLHWGGFDRASCTNALNARNLSTTFLAEGVLLGGVLRITQGLDLARVAYHVGELNGWTVGFDICRSPLPEHVGRYPGAQVVANTTGRGQRRCIGLEPQYAALLRSGLWAIAQALGIEKHACPGTDQFDDDEVETFKRDGAVVGHCNLESPARRWDPAPWMASLY